MEEQEERYTRVPNAILDDVTLSLHERAILVHIARKTIGYGKKSDGISYSQFEKATGMSASKAKSVIKSLREKRRIIVKKQYKADGGSSYNRYSLTPGQEVAPPSQEVDTPRSHGDTPPGQEVATQKIIEQNKIDKRRETETRDNIFHTLTEHEQQREANLYADHVSSDARNFTSYKAKVLKQIRKEHLETLELFEAWYLEKVCGTLSSKYAGKYVGEYLIESIYPYTDTQGYAKESHYMSPNFIYAQGRSSDDKTTTWGADSLEEMEALLEGVHE